jgi:hypothetical protein
MSLQQIGPDDEGPAMRQLGMCHLQLGTLAGDDCPILAPGECPADRPAADGVLGQPRSWAPRAGMGTASATTFNAP